MRRLKVFDDLVPQFHVNLQIERLLKSRLYEFLVGSHFILFDAFDDPGQTLYTHKLNYISNVLDLLLTDVSHKSSRDISIHKVVLGFFFTNHQNSLVR